MLNNLDLFKVRLISELVRTEALIGAAKKLRISSSAVSQNIRKLETVLGKPLFLRVGKGIKPTPLALEIMRLAQPFFADLTDLLEDSKEQIAEVKIGAPPIFGTTRLLDRIEVLRKSLPGLRISLSLFDTKKLTEDLLDGKVDFAFIDVGPHVKTTREIVTRPVATEILAMFCSNDFFRINLRHNSSIKVLKNLPHVPYHGGQEGTYKWYHHHYGRVPELPWTFAVDHAYGIKSAIAKGWGLGVLPIGLVNDLDRLTLVPGPKSELKSQILLAQNKARVPSRIEKSALGMLSKT